MVRGSAPARVRRAPAVRARSGRRAVRAVRSARDSRREQPVVVVARRGEAAGAGLSRCDGRRRPPRAALPLLQPRFRDDALPSSGRGAVGRASDAASALRALDLRLHPSRLLALGGGVRRGALRDRSSGRERASAALVGAEPASLARARRAASARFRRRDARAARRAARIDRQSAPRPGGAARAARARQPAGRNIRRRAQAHRCRSGDARAHDRANRECDGHAMGARHRLGARARGAVLRGAEAPRRRRR